jgi:hypothetical protein
LIRSGDPLAATKGLNPQALPIGYDDRATELGSDVLKLVENRRLGILNGIEATYTLSVFVVNTTGVAAAQFTDSEPCNVNFGFGDRCLLGQSSGLQPGDVGIGSGGTFAAGQRFAHGGQNLSGSPVSWDPEDRPEPGPWPFVRLGTFAVGEDGIPGCIGNNRPGSNALDACRQRLRRGLEWAQDDPNSTRAKWGQCRGGEADLMPVPPPCLETLAILHCAPPYPGSVCCPFHSSCNGDEPLLEFNTGVDDPELLIQVVDEGLGPRTDEGAFAPGTEPRFLIPNPSDPAPMFHLVGATTLRDLDVIEGNVDNVDVVMRDDITSCPISLATGQFECFRGDECAGLGGDTDGDGICNDGDGSGTAGDGYCTGGQTAGCDDNCPTMDNADQADDDADGVGQVCDNCLDHPNPRLESPLAFQNTTGGQLDQDMDGNGNRCDGHFFGSGTLVLPDDLQAFRASLFKLTSGNDCGGAGGAHTACAEYDLDGAGVVVLPDDLQIMKTLVLQFVGPKCAVCPLP